MNVPEIKINTLCQPWASWMFLINRLAGNSPSSRSGGTAQRIPQRSRLGMRGRRMEQSGVLTPPHCKAKCDRHYSLLCHRLAKTCGTPVAGVVTTDRETMSLRSSGFDTLPIAKAYGGGGHTKASGFPLSDRHRQELIDGDRLTPTE